MPEITVYGQPGCQQCRMTTRHLDRAHVPYKYRDVSIDQAAHDIVTKLGYQSLPVVTVGDMHWSGYRHAKLDRLAEIHDKAPDIAGLDTAAEQYLANDAIVPIRGPRVVCAMPGCTEHGGVTNA